MKKHLKKTLSAVLSLAMVAGSMVLPIAAKADVTPIFEGDTVLKEWKFDFGAADSTPEDGYTLVTPDTSFVTNKTDEGQFGFLGINEEDHNLTNRYDGWKTQKGQVIELAAGGTSENDAIGVVGAGGTDEENIGGKGNDIFGNKGDEYYPTRFALKVPDETYYRVRATVTTLDPSEDATVSLYTERKHPIYTQKTIGAGQTYTETFSVRVTPIYYEKTTPVGAIADEMLTVGVLGENSALVSVEIQQVDTIPTVWVLGDSTVTDGNCDLPFFPLQNYTGVGTGLTKYLRRDYAMVNEGEGGLNATDSNHFNMVTSRIKAGDYMYVEYGHNHKSDGPAGYKACLDKYYNACKAVGAKLLIVSPVQSVNSWNETTKRWGSRFGGDDNFEGAGKSYVAEKVTAGATDIAFVNLTKTSVEFVDKVTVDGGEVLTAAQFYYYAGKGGGLDQSHPNDAGAENFAHCFFEAAKEITNDTQKAVVADLLANMTDEQPNLVSAEVIAGGLGGSAWPQYIVPTTEKYPVVINDVVFDEDGTVKQVDVETRAAEIKLDSYGVVIVTIYNADGSEKGKLYATDQVDNSTGYGPQTIVQFGKDIILEEGNTWSAVVMEADADTKPVEGGKQYSAVYKPTDIAEHLIVNERNDDQYENFDFYNATYEGNVDDGLEKYNNWTKRGSSGMKLPLGEDNGTKYATISTDGVKGGAANQGSTYIAKDFVKAIGSSGRYIVSADMKYESGNGMNVKFVTGNTDKDPWGSDSITLFSVGTNGQITVEGKEAGQISATKFSNVKYIIDMDLGTASLSVNGGDEVTVQLPDYQSTSVEAKHPKFTGFMFEGNRVAFDVKVANLTVAKLKDIMLPEYTIGVRTNDHEMGSVELSWVTPEPEATEEPETTDAPTAEPTTEATSAPDVTDEPATEATDAPETTEAPTTEVTSAPEETDAPANDPEVEVQSADNDSLSLEVAPEKATVTSNSETSVSAVIIRAKYKNGALKELKTEPFTLAAKGETKTVNVEEGEKIMLWNSIEGMKPLAEAKPVPTATPIPYDEEATLTLNTVVIAKATANEGHVFMGWLDEKGKKISEDEEYTFRLRDNLKLTANFVKEPGVEDVVAFDLESEQASVKAVAGATVNVNVVNAKDSAGTPVAKVTNKSAEWSIDPAIEGVTVADGVVTIGEGFTMGDAETKTITVKAKLNGIEKTASIVANLYDYYEDFNSNDIAKTAWFVNKGDGSANVTNGELKLVGNGGKNNTYVGVHFAAPEDVVDKIVTVRYDYNTSSVASGGGNNTSHLFLANLGLTENTPTWDIGAKGTSLQNQTSELNISANTKYAVTIVINNKTKTGTITAQPASGSAVTYEIANTSDTINTVFFRPGKSVTDTVDNFRVVITDAE